LADGTVGVVTADDAAQFTWGVGFLEFVGQRGEEVVNRTRRALLAGA
jgi:hypothetical protein